MKISTSPTLGFVFASLIAANAWAVEISPVPVSVAIPFTQANKTNQLKTVRVMNLTLSAQEKIDLFASLKHPALIAPNNTKLPAAFSLGMNNTPVLDQGTHGTCVTFAQTAALDAALGQGDYVSQLCSLELGQTFQENGYMPSGWDGAFGPLILDQIMRFGYVSKKTQRGVGCQGYFHYPLQDQSLPAAMELSSFSKISENYLDEDKNPRWAWVPLLNVYERFLSRFEDEAKVQNTLLEIKKSITKGYRVTIGALLFTSKRCKKITCASYKANHDTWAYTPALTTQPLWVGGHEMVVYGYDDNAVATDVEGVAQKGLLLLRNSWGDDVGDSGNFYMTYDYFIKLALEAQKIVTT